MHDDSPPQDSATQPEAGDDGASWVGRTLESRYRVKSLLGRGGMGTTWLADDLKLTGKQVVVKVPHAELLVDPGFRARYRREVESLIALEHRAIVHVLDVGSERGHPFMVMQFLSGGSMAAKLISAPERRLPPAEVVALLRPIAGALDFMHERGILHRDVKPENVLLDKDGRAYLADFGIAKAITGADASLTATGFAPGTPKYMAPEQARSNQFDGKADQYALAVTAYEALSGRAPYDGETPVSLLINKQSEAPRPLDDLAGRIPPAAAKTLLRGLALQPADRFDDCVAFLQSLGRDLGLGTSAGMPLPTEQVAALDADGDARSGKGMPWKWAAAALLVIAGVVGAILAFGSGTPPETDPGAGAGSGVGAGPGTGRGTGGSLITGGSVEVDARSIEESLRVFTEVFGARDTDDERLGAATDILGRLGAYGLEAPMDWPGGLRRHQTEDGRRVNNVYACLPGQVAAEAENGLGEFILVTTWFDGQVGPDGKRHAPAANSNGSGVTAMLEVARCLAERAARDGPHRRSIVFAFFDLSSDRESPHLGASLEVAKPLLPFEDCACMLSVERLGRSLADVLPRVLVLMGTEYTPYLDDLADQVAYPHGDLLRMGLDIYAGSPQTRPFHDAGIPALLIGAGPSMDYGKPGDTVDALDMEALVARAEWVRDFISVLANDAERPSVGEIRASRREVQDIGRAIELGNRTFASGALETETPHQGLRTALGRLHARVQSLIDKEDYSIEDRKLLVQQLRLVWQVAALWRGR